MAKAPPKPEPRKLPRDAGTGRIVTEQYARTHPKTTVIETIKPPPKKR